MIHDARSNFGKSNANAALAPPTPTQYLRHQIQEKRNRMIENAIRDKNEIQRTYEENPFVHRTGAAHMNSARGNPARKVRPVVGNATPTSAGSNRNNDLFGNGNAPADKNSLFSNNLSIQIENDNFHGAPALSKGGAKSKRDLIWEQKRLRKLKEKNNAAPERGVTAAAPSEPTHSRPPVATRHSSTGAANSDNLNETTRDRIYREKREKYLRNAEREMGKRNDVSPTQKDDLYDFGAAKDPTPPTPPSRQRTAYQPLPSSSSQQQHRQSSPVKESLFGNDRRGPPLDDVNPAHQEWSRAPAKSPTQQWNEIASRPPVSSTHSRQRENSFASPSRDAGSRYPVESPHSAGHSHRRNASPASTSPNGGLFGKLGEQSMKPKPKFNHDIPQNPSAFSRNRDEKSRLIRQNEQQGGLFNNLGHNNDQQRYLARQRQSPTANGHFREPVPPPGRPSYISPLKRHSSPSPVSPSRYQIGLSPADQQRQKALKQQEYARALQEQIRIKEEEKSRLRRHSSAPSRSPIRQQPEFPQRSPPNRMQRINSYTNERSPQHRHHYSPGQRSPTFAPHRSPGSPRRIAGPPQQIGLSVEDERRRKMLQQQEYQRALDEQVQLKKKQVEISEADPLRGGMSRARTREPSPMGHPYHASRAHRHDYADVGAAPSPVHQHRRAASPPAAHRYESYPSPSHHVDRVPFRHDLPAENLPRKISTNDLRSSHEKRHDMRQKQQYGDFLKQQIEEKKRREAEEKRLREEAEMRHERQANGDEIPAAQDRRRRQQIDQPSPKNRGDTYDDDTRAGFDRIASAEPSHRRDLFGSPSPVHGAQRVADMHTDIPSPSHLSSPSNAHRGLLRYSEPAAVEEKQQRQEKQNALKAQLQQQMEEKKERERQEKLKIQMEEERERLRFEREQEEIKRQKEAEELAKRQKAQEEEENARMTAEETRRKQQLENQRRMQLEEEKYARDQEELSQMQRSPANQNRKNDLFGNDDYAAVSFPPSAAVIENEETVPDNDAHANLRRRPSRPQLAHNTAENGRKLSHRALVTPSEIHDDDNQAYHQFQNVHRKIDGIRPKENEDALVEHVSLLTKQVSELKEKVEQAQAIRTLSRESTPSEITSRRVIDPNQMDGRNDVRHSQQYVGLRAPSPAPGRSKSPQKLTTTKRTIPTLGRSEMMSVAASQVFDQSIDAHSEFLFPTALSARRSISRPSSRGHRPYIYESSGGLVREDDDISTYRPDTAATDISDASETNTIATMDTDRLAKKNRMRVSQLERLESVNDEGEKEKLMESYLQTGKIDENDPHSPRPYTAQSLPGTSQSILPPRHNNLPTIFDDPFEDGTNDAPVYKRLNSARSNLSDLSSFSQRPDSRRSSRPASRRSTRQRSMSTPRYGVNRVSTADSEISDVSVRPGSRRRRSSSTRKHRPAVEQSLSSHSTFVMRPDMDAED